MAKNKKMWIRYIRLAAAGIFLILAGLAAGLAVGLITHLVATRLPVLYWQRRNPE